MYLSQNSIYNYTNLNITLKICVHFSSFGVFLSSKLTISCHVFPMFLLDPPLDSQGGETNIKLGGYLERKVGGKTPPGLWVKRPWALAFETGPGKWMDQG